MVGLFPESILNIPSEKMRTRPKLFGEEQRTLLWFEKKREDSKSQKCWEGWSFT